MTVHLIRCRECHGHPSAIRPIATPHANAEVTNMAASVVQNHHGAVIRVFPPTGQPATTRRTVCA